MTVPSPWAAKIQPMMTEQLHLSSCGTACGDRFPRAVASVVFGPALGAWRSGNPAGRRPLRDRFTSPCEHLNRCAAGKRPAAGRRAAPRHARHERRGAGGGRPREASRRAHSFGAAHRTYICRRYPSPASDVFAWKRYGARARHSPNERRQKRTRRALPPRTAGRRFARARPGRSSSRRARHRH